MFCSDPYSFNYNDSNNPLTTIIIPMRKYCVLKEKNLRHELSAYILEIMSYDGDDISDFSFLKQMYDFI